MIDTTEPEDDNDSSLAVNVDDFEDIDLRMIAEKVIAMLRRDALFDRERRGLQDGWPGWRQS